MAERTVIQWDKDDIDALGLMKVDVLALGMLSAIRSHARCHRPARAGPSALADVPAEDAATYAMVSRADTVGVFQIESRAQMAMLPRLKPRLLLRPGDRGGAGAPRADPGRHGASLPAAPQGLEPVSYPGEPVREVLERTLGVPIFQEQAMQLAIVAAGFTPGEADQPAPRHGGVEAQGRAGALPRQAAGRHAGARLRRRIRRGALSPDPGLRRIRLSRVARGELRAAGVCLGLAQAPRAGGLPARPAQLAADGLLRALAAGAGCAPPRCRGAGRWMLRPALGNARWKARSGPPCASACGR
jgi:hypothetical protein